MVFGLGVPERTWSASLASMVGCRLTTYTFRVGMFLNKADLSQFTRTAPVLFTQPASWMNVRYRHEC
ncbi:hypothetical protein PanWU01x14_114310 [Parasponia andersonii]|uniref:Uncharacterized protein n=1 Tax=Parasponia andersonii TaxID=3476 RepID=A0A2P5CXB7_PARAD|nr:hypothetical protein PanWU01x14_114310 [Parasponia andersonii]